MNLLNSYPCGRVSRRGFVTRAAGGFFGAALGGLLAEDGKLKDGRIGPHFEPKAKSVIYLFMCGGVSQLDTFDPKDNKHAGKMMDGTAFGDNVAEIKRPVIPCIRTFKPCGKSGVPVSDILPNIGSVIDELAVVRSMWNHEGNHFPAVIETATGHRGRAFDHPCLGSWVSYALGSANKNLPTFVNVGRPSSPVQLTGGYLGAGSAATPFRSGDTPIPNLYPPKGGTAAERELQMQTLTAAQSGIPRDVCGQHGYRRPRAIVRTGGAHASFRARSSGLRERTQDTYWISTVSAKRRRTISGGSCSWHGGWWKRASATSSYAMAEAATEAGTRMWT